MVNKNQHFKYLLVTGLLFIGIFVWMLIQEKASSQQESVAQELSQPSHDAIETDKSEPSADTDNQDFSNADEEEPVSPQANTENQDAADGDDKPLDSVFDYGQAQPVSGDLNPQVASVAEALATDAHPERLSALIQPADFDRSEYLRNPQAYINIIEPGRVFQTAQPEEAQPIQRLSPFYAQIQQGERVSLKVRAEPDMPVTFTSFDLGAFENQLTSITVKAGSNGIAETEFIATPGTIADVKILAASPTSSGRIKFIVNIQQP